jgi:DNA-binding NtrC family response regulator
MSTLREPRWAGTTAAPPPANDPGPTAATRVHSVPPMSNTPRTPIRLLLVDDDEQMRRTLVGRFTRKGLTVSDAGSGEQALEIAAKARFDVAVLDLHLPGINGVELLEKLKERQPDMEALLLTAHSSVETAVAAMKKGAYDYLLKPFHLPELEVHVQKAYEKVQLARREQRFVQHLHREEPRHRLVGSSPAMKKIAALIEKVAPSDATVLVRGPSGTGKEVVARAIHAGSPRRDSPMVTINCAALQENLLESELFGHEKGAFTGAVQAKPGLVEVAEGGTLFIDEIGEMAVGLQAKLLRVLEDGHFRRVGGTTEQRADVRVVAATNRVLEDEIKTHRFREDLYYRLNVITMRLPPLRERRSDIPELVEYFLTMRQVRCRVTPEALEVLLRSDWPGNVRELANVLERAQILAEDATITVDDLPESLFMPATSAAAADESGHNLHAAQREHVLAVLREEKGNKAHAARVLGVSRRALYRLLEKYQIEKAEGPSGDSLRGTPGEDAN